MDGDPWLYCDYHYDFDGEGHSAYVINYSSYWRNLDGLLSTSMVFECKELGLSFRVPVVEYELLTPPAITIMHGNENVTGGPISVASGAEVTLNAIIGNLPDGIVTDEFDCGWDVSNERWGMTIEGEWILYPSPNLDCIITDENPLEVVLYGKDPGEDGIYFWYNYHCPESLWFEWLGYEVYCTVTVTNGSNPSFAPTMTRTVSPKARRSGKQSSHQKTNQPD